jgi:uncharacterized SAM-binding protein YcdF (DUF218 family)
MFVFLKILLFLFRPIIWIVILFVLSAFQKNEKRKHLLFRSALVLLLFFTNPFVSGKIIAWYEAPPVTLPGKPMAQTGILLGGFVTYNLKDDAGYFNPASDRFIQTALLYKQGQIHNIIIAAGNGYIVKHDFVEADYAKQHLITLGIPDSAIYVDGVSKNTEQNAANTKAIIDAAQLKGPFLLITSAMHIPRAKWIFEKHGIPVTPYPCDFASKNTGNNLLEDALLPSAAALRDWNALIKEWVGLLVYHIRG